MYSMGGAAACSQVLLLLVIRFISFRLQQSHIYTDEQFYSTSFICGCFCIPCSVHILHYCTIVIYYCICNVLFLVLTFVLATAPFLKSNWTI